MTDAKNLKEIYIKKIDFSKRKCTQFVKRPLRSTAVPAIEDVPGENPSIFCFA